MKDSFLLTKLFIPPSNSRDVKRSHLISRMNDGLTMGCKLTLISAPVGYGKTTLVSNWLAALKKPAAWLSLGPEDDDLSHFWSYVIAALQTVHPELGQMVLPSLKTAQPPPIENILQGLINQMSELPDKMILVIDDFHHLEMPGLHQSFNFFLNHLPYQLHLVILTREDPVIPILQMRAKGQLVELRIKDLRFTLEEAGEFLNKKMRLNLQPGEITTLGQRTEGWAAGLQMAALSMHALDDTTLFIEAFAGDNRYVADYLISEVLDRQPDQIRNFLLHTSVVDRFSPSLCDVLNAYEDLPSVEIIEEIEALGLFLIPLDHLRQWYRYHQLFADLLRFRLRQEDPARFIALNRTASRWFQQQGLIEEAVKYAIAGEDPDYLTELIEQSGLKMIGRSQLATLHNWINALPEKMFRKHPYISVLLAWVGSLTGQSELAKKQIETAEGNLPEVNADQYSDIYCQIALLRAYSARTSGDLDSSIRHALDALIHLPSDNDFLDCTIHLNLGGNYWLKGNFSALEEPLKHAISFIDFDEDEYPALAAAGFLMNAYLQQGKLQQAEALSQDILRRYDRFAHPAAAYIYLELGELCYERNDLDGALDVLEKAIQIGESADRVVNVIRARQLLSRAYLLQGNQEKAAVLMEQAEELFKQSSPRYQVMHQIEYEYYRIRCLLYQKKMQAALQWADEYQTRHEAISNPWATLNELVYAQVLLTGGKPDQALPILKICEDTARSYEADGWVIQCLTLQALCCQATDDMGNALDCLRSAFSLAGPEGYIRTFVDFGLPMQRLLVQAEKENIFPEYVAKLLSASSADASEKESTRPQVASSSQPQVEPLTDQEVNILRLMAAGLSHSEIASKLYLSINTVKWHSTNIYSKLGVHRRAHAVARGRELEIL